MYDVETTDVVKKIDLRKSSVILLAQSLIKNRSWNLRKTSYEEETCMFRELENTLKVINL